MTTNIRNKDNFTFNVFNYINTHLLNLNYLNSVDIQFLKLKQFVLDAKILVEEVSVIDNDFNKPVDHIRWLLAEVSTIDLYIRTIEKTLDVDEIDYFETQGRKQDSLNSFITTINEDTGLFFNDYEFSYENRPTQLSISELDSLKESFIIKRTAGELSSFTDVILDLSNFVTDEASNLFETIILTLQTPAEIEADLLTQAIELKKVKDDPFRIELNRIYDEIWTIITQVAGSFRGAWLPSTIYYPLNVVTNAGSTYILKGAQITSDPTFNASNWVQVLNAWSDALDYPPLSIVDEAAVRYANFTGADITNNPIFQAGSWTEVQSGYDYSSSNFGFANFPHRRVEVILTPDDSSHKGIFISSANGGIDGYRFRYLENTVLSTDQVELAWSTFNQTDLTNIDYDKNELDMDNAEAVTANTDPNPSVVLSRGNITSLLPSGSDTLNEVSLERYNELKSRWKIINHFRENEIQNVGTRYILESLVDQTVPDLSPDYTTSFENSKLMKIYFTNILKELLQNFI